ncbi:bifunctional phosphoribosyl-AMP cyclohydrolase/phosphoribosyl-ATP diphosphatase HisIE [Photobacterium carnosum]|uniref:bifunctional phosphoribosyl-AMP cyclohydrolase/phosphoribosyl-ATP diphosphatase HisIE n=1 Tax=Photobacterium carnosum TaxID=2023717 RepID=UPI001E3380A4|nr:bifunctional phosphoribosyl-AMP cyclohydrolase/phosphoribosyl-ATP diphosphatase HisIE [Photobacterium carnosum]MCD9528726.1 bifunctional phosphoribosyl-AMP cyclohydrolase/phosphoribosyl-ATP diphosphatase HisIE [Photobacterium carnosum]MCF2152685.1 bifunctional phosphoribosyl-AMP cyclohydrolase/phosphoribosyl-ATP diphosphatase HisIE [Photobacterium carnosum]MCF2214445.1 bifunctional phosphoribosyl-AMP cyclohydrolase/phosphoribosyl-ATP diphosphatase HisIE [Photobacterium carnosum]
MSLTTSIDWEKVAGLIPAIIQDNNSGQVLMLGYMNDEALAKTLATEHVTFWSRTKNRLWTKGETSGNILHLKSIKLDCDQDTLLVQVDPMGPTCHLNTTSCFGNDDTTNTQPALVFLHQLEQILTDRKGADPDSSYTASLYARGTKRISQKVGEEGVEVALAAASGDKAELVCESADLIYHLLVLLQDQNLTLEDVINKLKQRHQQ